MSPFSKNVLKERARAMVRFGPRFVNSFVGLVMIAVEERDYIEKDVSDEEDFSVFRIPSVYRLMGSVLSKENLSSR